MKLQEKRKTILQLGKKRLEESIQLKERSNQALAKGNEAESKVLLQQSKAKKEESTALLEQAKNTPQASPESLVRVDLTKEQLADRLNSERDRQLIFINSNHLF